MRETLQPYIAEDGYRQILPRYHFQEKEEDLIRSLTKQLYQVLDSATYFACKSPREENRLAVLVTLGSGVDHLQEAYTKAGQLTEGYMIECIAMKLLKNAYEQAADKIYSHYGRWAGRFEFLGEAVPIEALEEMFTILEPKEISYNQAYMLMPKKTAAFFTTLTENRQTAYCNFCQTCSHVKCVHRQGNPTYRYQQTFRNR